ncbi:hypothetical protein [Alkalicoccus urumqiensis]|uniref:Uncharacterized protein n=1 Tax=Alkalicoccus urumqiensis TaxID=1548213 RepID=A0A2P6MGL9_ALKUR|nr:hypothetical protein [Alkalicoccus urumqiensis]PRO65417.1 hypothetical protein C6I21_09665 [Alkalicoccus urumqiensis]
MKAMIKRVFTVLYGEIPENSQLRLYYWVTAVVFFIPILLSPLFLISYFVQGGMLYGLVYGSLMLLVVWVGMPLFFRLIMKMNHFLFNEKDEPKK